MNLYSIIPAIAIVWSPDLHMKYKCMYQDMSGKQLYLSVDRRWNVRKGVRM